MPIDWDNLISSVRESDWQAEERCFRESKAILLAVYRKRNWQWKMPEDVAESIMHLSIAKAIRKYRRGKYASYLVATFVHDVCDEWLRPRRPITVSIDDDDADGPKLEPVNPIPFMDQILANEEREILLDCMKQLTSDRRQSLQLWLEGWTLKEIEKHVPERSIKDLLHHAKLQLKECFENRMRLHS